MMNTLRNLLEQYSTLSDNDWEQIESCFRPRILSKHEHFLKAGEVCRKLGFVVSGFLRTYIVEGSGKDVTTHFAYEQSIAVSFFSFKKQQPSFEFIQATEPTQLLEISYDDLNKLLQTSAVWREVYYLMIEEAYACMERRTYVLQNLSAREKYAYLMQEESPYILQKANLGYISSYLGMQQETLSRVRKAALESNVI